MYCQILSGLKFRLRIIKRQKRKVSHAEKKGGDVLEKLVELIAPPPQTATENTS
jgi:hypothetical protein